MRGLEAQLYGGGPWARLPWLWHALLDGTPFCRCRHSAWYRGGPGPREVRDPTDGTVTAIVYDGARLPGPARPHMGHMRW